LKQYWGFDQFRLNQDKIIQSVLDKKDCLVILPTGGGKSLCYQIPGLCFDGLTLVISPLIALMKDQIDGLTRKRIKAVGLYSGQSKKQQDIILDNAAYDKRIKFLFVSPERLKSKVFLSRVHKMKIALLAVDEAHCISEWGHDFRPEYRQIADIKEILPSVPIIALTATATPEVKEDILSNLQLNKPAVYLGSPVRQNLKYSTLYSESKKEMLHTLVKKIDGSQIIYTNTRKSVMEIQRYFNKANFPCNAFHGGMNKNEREACINAWSTNEIRLIVATKAFGMGIDKSDVRQVLHYNPPGSLEAYVQEAGRAGRDGKSASVTVLYNKGDVAKIKRQLDEIVPEIDYMQSIYKRICQDLNVATGPCDTEFYPFYINEFCAKYNLGKFKVANALKFLHQSEIIYLSEAIRHPSRLRMYEGQTKQLLSNPNLSSKMDQMIRLILRTYEGLFLGTTVIDEKQLSKNLVESKSSVQKALNWLDKKGIASYTPNYEGHTISFMEFRYRSDNIPINMRLYKNKKMRMHNALDSILSYLSTDNCRQILISNYFGFQENDCKVCDNCFRKFQSVDVKNVKHKIYKILSEGPVELEEVLATYDVGHRDSIVSVLKDMLSESEISRKGSVLKLP